MPVRVSVHVVAIVLTVYVMLVLVVVTGVMKR